MRIDHIQNKQGPALLLGFTALLLAACIVAGASVVTADAKSITSDFLVKKWTTEEGLPQNTVTSIVQTADGYIWLGTFGGLARFDGVKFTVFDSVSSPGFNSNRVLSLYEDRWERLWIGTETGEVYVHNKGSLIEYELGGFERRSVVWGFIESGAGDLYISSDSGIERLSFGDDGSVLPGSTKILSTERTYGLCRNGNGIVWVRVRGFLFYDAGDSLKPVSELNIDLPNDILTSDFSKDGTLYVASMRSVGTYSDRGYRELEKLDPKVHKSDLAIKVRNNSLWLQQANELIELIGDRAIRHDLSGTIDYGSRAMLFDTEDNLWLATQQDGLVRLTPRRIKLLSDLEGGNDTSPTYSVIQDRKGVIWIGGASLRRIEDGVVSTIAADVEPGRLSFVKPLAVDENDDLWFGAPGRISKVSRDGVHKVIDLNEWNPQALYFDNEATLWIGTNHGLLFYRNDRLGRYDSTSGLVNDSVNFVTRTRDGRLWVGTGAGLSILDNGQFTNYTMANGLPGNIVRDVVELADGTIWIGTYGGGLSRWRGGEIKNVSTSHGLHDNFISRILVDDVNRFWILGNQGVFSVRWDDLDAVADGRTNSLIGAVYGVADGMKSSEANGGHQPAGIRTKDGRLWFPMIKGAVIIDPKGGNQTPPKVVIESVSTRSDDARSLPTALKVLEDDSITIPTGQRDLEVQFTGLSFTKPENIRFYYRLDDLDNDWTDAGNRREAFYPYLPAGNYTFRVRAVNAMGLMSENIAVLKISVDKPFWRTWWFISFAVLGSMFAAFTLYWFKMEQMRTQRLKEIEFSKQLLNAQEIERGRIASELHDGLGQNLLILRNWAQLGLDATDDPEEVRENLLQISETAARSIDETRAIVRNLSPQNLKRFGLTEAIRNMVEQLHGSTGVVFESTIDDIDRLFPDEAELSIYRIVQECLNNVVKHSESPRGRVSITRSLDEVEIIIEDYGKGFSANDTLEFDDPKRGFGVQSIIQRVKLLGGEIDFESQPSEGTTIRIRLKS